MINLLINIFHTYPPYLTKSYKIIKFLFYWLPLAKFSELAGERSELAGERSELAALKSKSEPRPLSSERRKGERT
jgi:hypothetical protein